VYDFSHSKADMGNPISAHGALIMQLALITHKIENDLVLQRASDGYVNATAMCKASGKLIGDYGRLQSTQAFLKELSLATGLSVAELVIVVKGGEPEMQGTWVHPDVAINLGQWCSPKFAVAVSGWVREWLTGKAKPEGLPYHIQRYVANRSEIPASHFSMLNEMIFSLIGPLEMAGYTLPEDMIPDISTGRMFCKWLREKKGIDTDALPTYRHVYADGRIVPAKLYPNEVLADFREYFNNDWLPNRATKYFAERDANALPHLPKLLTPKVDGEIKMLKPPTE
jgi:hypothetical protein